jgi:hypothetical protein
MPLATSSPGARGRESLRTIMVFPLNEVNVRSPKSLEAPWRASIRVQGIHNRTLSRQAFGADRQVKSRARKRRPSDSGAACVLAGFAFATPTFERTVAT